PGSREEALRAELDRRIGQADPALSPAALSLIAIRTGQRHAGSDDPFREIKKHNNRMALRLYPDLKERAGRAPDPLRLACQLAACGNIIDLGIHEDFDIHATIEKVLREGFARDDYGSFVELITQIHHEKAAPRLLYICDNAGEIVFDRIFIEELLRVFPRMAITAVVRQVPVLNDATMDDARETGLTEVVRVIDNGNAELGTVFSTASDELRNAFAEADVIVSKGQANYETLPHDHERLFFILKAKCEVIAASLGVNLWDAVMLRGG
nr:ARMT1-like domain-containing protein [bacterium]